MVHSRKRASKITKDDGFRRFCAYYKAQFELIDDQEFDDMIKSMNEPLPVSFRLNTSKSSCPNKVEEEFFEHVNKINAKLDSMNETRVTPIRIPWCGPGVYQINLSRQELRQMPEYDALKNFFVLHIQLGNLTRQELVSMIPPRLLNVRPHHKVLDMCAAPGSKTSQLLEIFSSDDNADGFVIANDKDIRRCYTLWHQIKRFNCPNIAVLNHDASMLPNWRYTPNKISPEKGEYSNLTFDRILCDVPCSGDGTTRKNEIFKRWNPSVAYNLHGVQLRIAKRAVEILKSDGGLMVYSTCSLNPVENEAVIARLLNMYPDQLIIEKIPCDILGGLKWSPGLTKWILTDKDCTGKIYDNFDQIEDNKLRALLRPELFPPENGKDLNLDRCIRILPHYQNTGGFFVCVLRKIGQSSKNVQELSEERLKNMKHECPYIFIADNDQLDQTIRLTINEYLQEKDRFPFELLTCRASGSESHKNVYYINQSLRPLLELNTADRLKLVGAGLRFMTNCTFAVDGVRSYRFCGEALVTALKYVDRNKLIVRVESEKAFIELLKEPVLYVSESNETNEEIYKKIKTFEQGCTIVFEFARTNFVRPMHIISKVGKKRKGENDETICLRTFISHSFRFSMLSLFMQDQSEVEQIINHIKEVEKECTSIETK